MVGLVASSLMCTVAEAVLPALSAAVAVRSCPRVSVVTCTGAGQDAMPEPVSSQVYATVTSVLFQPPAFGIGDRCVTIVGGVVSRLRCTVVDWMLPALSV